MTQPDAALGLAALAGYFWLGPIGFGYLGWAQRRRHAASALALALVAAALAVIGAGLAAGHAPGGALAAGLGLTGIAALAWKLALRRAPGFRTGETVAERVLPMLIVADLLLLLLAWPAAHGGVAESLFR